MTKLSIQGAGIMGRPSVSADLFDTLSQANINVRLIATSEIKVSCVIEINNIPKAIRFVAENLSYPIHKYLLIQSMKTRST